MNFISFSNLLAKRPRLVLFVFTLITIVIALQATNLYMESDLSSYLPRDDPTLVMWEKINKEFNIGQTIVIIVNQNDRYHDDIRDYEVLQEMYKVSYVLLEKPLNEGKESGIASIQSIATQISDLNFKENGKIGIPENSDKIYDYMENFEVKATEGILYTDDFKYAIIIIQLKENADFNTVLNNVKDVVKIEGNDETHMEITGTIAMQEAMQRESMKNLILIFPIALALVAIVIFFFHRSFKGIIIAFIPPAFALVLTFGTLGIFAPELTIISVAIVALLMGLGVDYSIHLMNRMVEEKNIEDKIKRIDYIIKTTGKAVLLSTVTTIIGFASLMTSSMPPMITFGFGCALGILYCFISAIILVPCLVIILKFEKTASIPKWRTFAKFTLNYRNRIIILASFFAVMSLILIPQIKTDVNYYEMAPENVQELDAMYEYTEKFGGGGNYNALYFECDPFGLDDPATIEAIYEMENLIRAKGVTVTSIASSLKDMNDILSTNVITETFRNLTEIDNILFDRIAEEGIVDEIHSKTLISVAIPIGLSSEETEEIVYAINDITADYTNNNKIPNNGHVSELIGQDAVNVAVNKKLSDEQVQSMMIALILVLAALIFIFSSTKFGVLTMIPVFFVLMWEPGFLILSDIPLSPVTITIASIMVGIGIDYGVHITHRVREEMSKGQEKTEAIINAVDKTGLSLVEAALTTVAGMASILFIGIPALSEFVIVIIFMVSMSCIAAALILPAIFKFKFVK